MRELLSIIVLLTFAWPSLAQKERKYVRDGNEHYEQGYFDRAEDAYNQALDARPDLLEAEFNRGTALFRQEKFEEAAANFDHVAAHTADDNLKASAYHNQGNSLMAAQDLEGAIEAYKNALRTDPSREDTRHNLALAQQILKQQQEQQEQNQDQQNQDQKEEDEQENQDQQQDQDGEGDQGDQDQQQGEDQKEGENEDQQGSQGEDQQDGEEGDQKDQQGKEGEEQQGSEQEGKSPVLEMSQEEMERLLQSLIREEQNTQDKVNKKKLKGQKIKTDKDW